MKYMGSKFRYTKYILPLILTNRKPGQWYVEPFVGGANVIDKVPGNRIGNDSSEFLIELLRALQNGWTPPISMPESTYQSIKNNPTDYPKELVGFAGFPCSYAAKWFGGYCRGFTDKGFPRDYILEAYNNCMKQVPSLQGIEFRHGDYLDMAVPEKSIIYCDPPYLGTTKYKENVNHDEFWGWCSDAVSQGHEVFVSEYEAPDGWECVWEKEVNSSLTKNTGSKRATEKLFTRSLA